MPPELKIEHCEDCNVCILNYDHHCVWTGKCIGKYNYYAFYIFAYGGVIHIMLFFVAFLFGLAALA